MMYEVTFKFPENKTVKVSANDKEDAFDKALEEILDNNVTIEVKESDLK